MRRWIAFALAASAAAGAIAAVWLGLPDVAATTPHWRITEWILSTTMEHAVERRAAGMAVPGDLAGSPRIRAGARAYDAMCSDCHGAPGAEPGAVAAGLLPAPPKLEDEAPTWSAAELFWITRHGIRMTGMPAFGPTHSDRDLWDVVAFLQLLPGMSEPEYRALLETSGHRHEEGHGHTGHAH
jgi:mono/diheme cytochrome c family protein